VARSIYVHLSKKTISIFPFRPLIIFISLLFLPNSHRQRRRATKLLIASGEFVASVEFVVIVNATVSSASFGYMN